MRPQEGAERKRERKQGKNGGRRDWLKYKEEQMWKGCAWVQGPADVCWAAGAHGRLPGGPPAAPQLSQAHSSLQDHPLPPHSFQTKDWEVTHPSPSQALPEPCGHPLWGQEPHTESLVPGESPRQGNGQQTVLETFQIGRPRGCGGPKPRIEDM